MLLRVVAIGTAELPEALARNPKPDMGAKEMVPDVVMGPPVKPDPVATEVTVPDPAD
jgi:hypothetical protein